MARKKRDAAISDVTLAEGYRLEFLKRNPSFRREVEEVEEMPARTRKEIHERIIASNAVAKKWGVDVVPPIALEKNLIRLPVSVSEKPDHFIITVKKGYPVDDLLLFIDRQLRSIYRAKRRRRRTDKAEFQLRVFDLAMEAKTFSEIARELQRRISTVKSAYLVACHKIYGPGKQRKKSLPLVSFDPRNHCQTCPTCQSAQKPTELCSQARLYMAIDTRGQREQTGYTEHR